MQLFYPKVVQAKVHEKYRQDFHDLALLKVDRDFVFSDRVRPICMPLGPRFPDNRKGAHVAGWGHVKNRACHTGEAGPTPFTQCAFPFRWRNETHAACAKTPTPSADNPLCRVARRKLEDRTDVADEASGQRLTSCYAAAAGADGWCATCRVNATEGQPNFCPPPSAASAPTAAGANVAPPPVSAPSLDGDWGVCKPSCSAGARATTSVLREVKLTIFDIGNCSEILKRSNSSYNLDMELCAGSVNTRKIRTVKVRMSYA